MRIAAFDLSLTATGWATSDGLNHQFGVVDVGKLTGMLRLDHIMNTVVGATHSNPTASSMADLILFEDLSFGSNDPSAQERAGLAYIIRRELWLRRRETPYILVAPSALKKFVTGKGNAKKELMMLEVFKRFGIDTSDNNIADAVGLMHIGLAIAGRYQTTMGAQREVLDTLAKSHPWISAYPGLYKAATR